MDSNVPTVTPRQIELFHKLTTDREFPNTAKIEELRTQFATLNKASASAWIDAALNLPKLADEDGGTVVPPSF